MDAPDEAAGRQADAQASVHMAASVSMDTLDRLANEVFGGRAVRKDWKSSVRP